MSQSLEHCSNPLGADEAFAEECKKSMAEMVGASTENVEFISWEEYQTATASDQDDEWTEEDDWDD